MIYLKTSIGIALDGEDMTLASLQGNLSGGTLAQYMHVPDFQNRDIEELRQEIQLFLKNNLLGKDNIVIGIPRRDILLRYLDLPGEVSENLKQVIQYQVQSFEPTEEDSYYYDYALLGKNPKNKRLSILLAMIRKNLLDDYLQRLFDLGIQPAAVTCSSLAVANLFLQNRKNIQDKNFILAHTTPSSLSLLLLQNGVPVYSQETPKGENQSWKELILKETEEAVSRNRLDAESAIEQIVLAGDASESAYAELKVDLEECTRLKDTVSIKSNESTAPYLEKAASTIGLAFTGMTRHPAVKINLIPAAFRFKQSRWAYISAAVIGFIIVALLAGLFFHQQMQSRKLVEELDLEINELKDPANRVMELRKETETLAGEIDFIEKLYQKQDMNLEVLQELTQLLPLDTYLTNYQYRDGKITLQGLSDSASDLVLTLESSPILKEVSSGSIRRDTRTGKERFQIVATLVEE